MSIGSKSASLLQWGQFDPNFQVEGVTPNHSSSHKTRINDLSYGIKIWTELSSVLLQSTNPGVRVPQKISILQSTSLSTADFCMTHPAL